MVDVESYPESSQHASGSGGTGLRLVLPSLKTVQALKGKKRQKSLINLHDEQIKKTPRPVKLKPLKEVLTKLIAQIKKKDDYAFFLQPVDVSQVPGYMDVVKRPMDLGTMTTKAEKGRYRSLEEFADDLRLVTSNAKTFNPPGTIYHTEAERIEAWGLEHIAKAAGTVIEYETDWNIEIERDDAEDDAGAEKGTQMDVDDNGSVTSLQTPATQTQMQSGGRRRGGAAAKKPPGALSESLEDDGGLPGAKNGLGAFPPGSDWAELMLALKLKGKRYRTKKERLRMERGGPPYRADGSLDYTELDNPFSVLSFFVPDRSSRPQLTPLYPSLPPSEPSQVPLPAPVNILVSPTSPTAVPPIPSLVPTSRTNNKNKSRRRHWTIVRSAPGRSRGKDRDDEDDVPEWQTPREPVAEDYGAYATLVSELSKERRVRDVEAELGSEERLFDVIRESIEGQAKAVAKQEEDVEMREAEEYWRGKGEEAEAYLRDVVYGGVDGLAYVRSLAEFVRLHDPLEHVSGPPSYSGLGMPLARWVEQYVLDPLTDGRHRILSETARRLHDPYFPTSPAVSAQLALSLEVYPRAAVELADLRRTLREKIDMVSLIRQPEELHQTDDLWAAKAYREAKQKEEQHREKELEGNAAAMLQFAIEKHKEAEAGLPRDGPEVMQYALQHTADAIQELGRKVSATGSSKEEDEHTDGGRKAQAMEKDHEDIRCMITDEDPLMKQLRLNLLALVKRAPLDQIAKLPQDLLHERSRAVLAPS